MAVKLVVDSVEDIPRLYRQDYEQGADGKWHLILDGKHPDTVKLGEFRTRNIELMKEAEELRPLKAKYEGIDPDAARAALANAADAEKMRAKLAAFDGVDADEYRRLKARPDPAKLEAELAAETAAHQQAEFRNIVTAAFLKAGGRESAVDYMVSCASKVFDTNGTTKELSTKNPGVPLTIAEWVEQQSKVADFAYLPSKGGGARPSPAGTHQLGEYNRQGILRDPTPQQLGEHSREIASGKLKVVYS